MNIIIDVLEPPNIVSQIKKYPAFIGSKIEVKQLPAGDVWIDDDLIIERKTISDLLGSVADGRLLNQAAEMRALTEWCYVVICGPLQWYNQKIAGTKWHFRSIQGALLRVQEFGVNIVYAADEQDFAATCAWLASRDKSKIIPLSPRKYGIPMTVGEKIISALPNIGHEKATKLLNEYGSAIDVLICFANDDCSLPIGFGDKTRLTTKEALGLSIDEKIGRLKNE